MASPPTTPHPDPSAAGPSRSVSIRFKSSWGEVVPVAEERATTNLCRPSSSSAPENVGDQGGNQSSLSQVSNQSSAISSSQLSHSLASVGLHSTPSKTSSPASKGAVSGGSKVINEQMFPETLGRYVSNFYTITSCDSAAENAIRSAVTSPKTRGLWDVINKAISKHALERELEQPVAELGNDIREQLCGRASDYGIMIPHGNLKVSNPVKTDLEENKPDIIIQTSMPKVALNHVWSDLCSFVELKRSSTDDCTDATTQQCLRYARKLFQYAPLKSHLHFLTWCGYSVRLWYVDSVRFGCSRVWSCNKIEDQLEIGKAIALLTLEECRGDLDGRWDIMKYPPNQVGETHIDWDLTTMEELKVRPGLFGSRTSVWAGKTKDMVDRDALQDPLQDVPSSERIFIKTSWLPPHLIHHEFEMQRGLAHLDTTPDPIGVAKLEHLPAVAKDFKFTTLQVPTGISNSTGSQASLSLCILVFKSHMGIAVPSEISTESLLRLHHQLAEVLLSFAEKGYHYRDFNTGNVRIRKGTTDELLLIDHGNMRKDMAPRGNKSLQGAQKLLERSRDDARSANPCFLPVCTEKATEGVIDWNTLMNMMPDEVAQPRIKDIACDSVVEGVSPWHRVPSEEVEELREALREVTINSHRYIDDLESALYLHVYQAASLPAGSRAQIGALEENLKNLQRKNRTWSNASRWRGQLLSFCRHMPWVWLKVMCELRGEIWEAQRALRQRLRTSFDQQVRLDDLMAAWEDTVNLQPNISFVDAVEAVFKAKVKLTDSESMFEEERDCFRKCSNLLKGTAEEIGQ